MMKWHQGDRAAFSFEGRIYMGRVHIIADDGTCWMHIDDARGIQIPTVGAIPKHQWQLMTIVQ